MLRVFASVAFGFAVFAVWGAFADPTLFLPRLGVAVVACFVGVVVWGRADKRERENRGSE